MNVFITGVSKGIGLALAKEALKKGHQVIGVARNPDSSADLLALKKSFPLLTILKVDLQDPEAAQNLLDGTKQLNAIDVLINNAGVYADGVTEEAFLQSFKVNTIAPFMVTQTFIPKLRNSTKPKLIHLSSAMGSIAENTSGGSYAYRASKAALNMVNKCLTIENSWLTTAVIHPGWVQTDMGGANAPVSTTESSQGIWNVIDELNLQDTGCFKDYQGRDLPW